MTRFLLAIALVAALFTVVSHGVPSSRADSFPEVIPLPNGWLPEGIVVGKGDTIYSGSRRHGAIYAASLRTGEGSILVPPQEDRIAVGLSFDRRTGYIFAAGGPGGALYVYDSATGEGVAEYPLEACGDSTFINDVVVTREAAYVTDSFCPFLHKVPLGAGDALPDAGDVETIPLSGDYVHQDDEFNKNGIEATPNGKFLVVVQSSTGLLFRVDPETGVATEIDLGGELVTSGDGILLKGNRLYVVRNFLNLVTEVRLNGDLTSGEVVEETSSPLFRIPTTIDNFGSRLYVVNARFDAGNDPTLEYEIVQVP